MRHQAEVDNSKRDGMIPYERGKDLVHGWSLTPPVMPATLPATTEKHEQIMSDAGSPMIYNAIDHAKSKVQDRRSMTIAPIIWTADESSTTLKEAIVLTANQTDTEIWSNCDGEHSQSHGQHSESTWTSASRPWAQTPRGQVSTDTVSKRLGTTRKPTPAFLPYASNHGGNTGGTCRTGSPQDSPHDNSQDSP